MLSSGTCPKVTGICRPPGSTAGGSAGQPRSPRRGPPTHTKVRAPRSMSSRGPRWRSSRPLAEPAAGWIVRCGVRHHRGGALSAAGCRPPKRPGPHVRCRCPPPERVRCRPRAVSLSRPDVRCRTAVVARRVRCRLLHRRSGSRCRPRAGPAVTEVTALPTSGLRPHRGDDDSHRLVQLPEPANRLTMLPRVDRPRPLANRVSWPLRRWRPACSGEPVHPMAMRSGQRARRSSAASPANPSTRRLRGPRPSEPGRGGRPLSG